MGLFSRKPQIDPQELVTLRQELFEIRGRLEATERAKVHLEGRLQQLDTTTAALTDRSRLLDDVTSQLADVDALKRQITQIDVVNARVDALDRLDGTLAELAERVHTTSDDVRTAKEQTVALHERISNVTNELANQLGELSSELDALASRPAHTPAVIAEQLVSIEIIDQVKTAQVRLANEQARYEIAFRQDLASLAEKVNRRA